MLYSAKKIHSQLDLKVGFGNWSADFLCRYNCEKVRTSWISIDYILDESSAIDAITRGQAYNEYRRCKKGGDMLDGLKVVWYQTFIQNILDMSIIQNAQPVSKCSTYLANYEKSFAYERKDDKLYFNWTAMGKPYGKNPAEFLRLQYVKDMCNNILSMRNMGENHNYDNQSVTLFETRRGTGACGGGTWSDNTILTIEFARWLDPRFAIWCNQKIEQLMTKGVATMRNDVDDETLAMINTLIYGDKEKAKSVLVGMVGITRKQEKQIVEQGMQIVELQETVSNLEEELDEAGNKIEKKGEEFTIHDSAPRYYAPIGKQFFKSNFWAENCAGLYKRKGIYEALQLDGCVVKDRDYGNWKVKDPKDNLFITVFNKKGKSDCAEIIGFSVYYDTRRPEEVWDLIKDNMEYTEKFKKLLKEQNNNIR